MYGLSIVISKWLYLEKSFTHTKQNKENTFKANSREIKNSVEDRQSQIEWQTVNEVCKKKITTRAKQKAAY